MPGGVWPQGTWQRLLAEALPPLPASVRERLVAILLAGQVPLALPLLEGYAWDAPVPEAALVAWRRAPQQSKWKKRLADLLVERLGPPARTAMQALAGGHIEAVPQPPFAREQLRRMV